MFMHIKWNDSIDLHPSNKPNEFIVDLPKTLQLEDDWETALTDIKIKSANKSSFYLFTDFCEESCLKGTLYPVLHRVDQKETQYCFPYFVKVNKTELRSIKFTILDPNLKAYDLTDFQCTLYLRKR